MAINDATDFALSAIFLFYRPVMYCSEDMRQVCIWMSAILNTGDRIWETCNDWNLTADYCVQVLNSAR
jgi:hypothetical protein